MKKIVLLIISFLFFIWTVTALEISISWNDNWNYTDWYKFDTSINSNIIVNLIDKFSSTYTNGNRVDIIQNWYNWDYLLWDWILNSELYWDFYIKSNVLELINDTVVNSNCSNVSYSFKWILVSPSWWNLSIMTWSYFCPLSWKNSLILSSSLLWNIVLSDTNIWNIVTTTNSRWEEQNVSNFNTFDDKKISINWLSSLDNIDWIISDYSNNNSSNIQVNIDWKMANFNKVINKNLAKYINWIIPITNNTILNWFSKKIHYYDFEWQEDINISNVENKWLILTIWNWWLWNYEYYKMWVTWQKLLYIKWWNIYIDSDIYNNSETSQLVIIVKRESINNINWWNIYINPNVTNIDATLIADWSIISFDWTNILNAVDNTDSLRKQLLIYWSISTKNTFWEDKAIYWTDSYISNWWLELDNIWTYNLAKLRSFQTMLNDDVDINDSCSWTNSIVARWNTWIETIQYAFAWKKYCYLDGDTQSWLRSTNELAPLVIEYNPILQTNPHFILQNN
jgi:hypothetical protein